MRLAGRALEYLGRMAIPRTEAGRIAGGQLALEYGGNVLGAALTGLMAGGGTPGGALAVGAEDLALGLAGSLLGRTAGDLTGRKLLRITDPEKLNMARLAGSMPLEMGIAALSPRPILDGIAAQRAKEAQVQQAAAAQEERAEQREESAAEAFAAPPAAQRSAIVGPVRDPFEDTVRRVLGASGGDARLYQMLGVQV